MYVEYNDAMGGIELPHQYAVQYCTMRKRMKYYYQKIFCSLLDITIFSAYVITRNMVVNMPVYSKGKGKKIKFSLCLTKHHAMKSIGEWRYSSMHS
jgi:hypothetical protein